MERPFHFNPAGENNLLFGPAPARQGGVSVFYRVRRRLRERLGLLDPTCFTVLPNDDEELSAFNPQAFQNALDSMPRYATRAPELGLSVADSNHELADFALRLLDFDRAS